MSNKSRYITSILLSSLFFSQSILADGCMSLANTSWTGQAKLVSRKVSPINVSISSVSGSDGFFKLAGTINNEPITGMFGCMERSPGVISSIAIDTDNFSTTVSSIKFSPDAKNPTNFLALSGKLKNEFIDTTNDPSKNYLIKNTKDSVADLNNRIATLENKLAQIEAEMTILKNTKN